MMKINLRNYQIDLISEVFSAWNLGIRNVLLQLPTGGGKTVLFSIIANELLIKQEPILIVAHRRELIFQAEAKLNKVSDRDLEIGIIKAKVKPNPEALIQIASIQSLARREYPPASLVIIDEAHHAYSQSYAKLIDYYSQKGAYTLGVTATPRRTGGKGLSILSKGVKGFEKLICGPSVKELINSGYLSDFKVYSPSRIIDAEESKIRTIGGDYSSKELNELVETTLIIGDVIETWKKLALNKRTILFATSCKHSKEIAKAFRKCGIPAKHLDANTSEKTRDRILKSFERGKTLVLCQYSIVSEGIDIPSVEAIQFTRPTKSLIFWFQAIGRALRPCEGKTHAIIIDHTDTCKRLGLPNDSIEWSLEEISRSTKPKVLRVNCPQCYQLYQPLEIEIARQITECPHCKTIFGIAIAASKKRAKKLQADRIIREIPAEFELLDKFDFTREIDKLVLNNELKKSLHKALRVFEELGDGIDFEMLEFIIDALAKHQTQQDINEHLNEIIKDLSQMINNLSGEAITIEENHSKQEAEFSSPSECEPTLFEEMSTATEQIIELSPEEFHQWKWDEINALARIQINRKYKKGWLAHRLISRADELKMQVEDWNAVGNYLGYKKGWGFFKYREQLERHNIYSNITESAE